jgi:hypothetical protein
MNSQVDRRYSQIGLDRIVRLKWLERTSLLVLAGHDAPAVKSVLGEELKGSFRTDRTKIRGSLDKTITILMRIWVRAPNGLHSLQHDGLKLFPRLPHEDHVALHWGMTMAVYPFWRAVAAHVGRLLRLQGMAAASQVQRRVREHYGERDTVTRAAQRVLRSFVDWEVLKETPEKGLYTQGIVQAIDHVELIAWLVEAFLHAHPDGSMPLIMALDSTSLFPFRLSPISADHLATVSGRLDVLRHGLDQDLIMLHTVTQSGMKGGWS